LNGRAVQLAELDRARMHHARAKLSQLEHLFVADLGQFASAGHQQWSAVKMPSTSV